MLVLRMSGVHFCDSGGPSAVIRIHLRTGEAGAVLCLVSPVRRWRGGSGAPV
ncbi:hypothetical protein [Kitasatospora paranensis]|uniref:Uncharacterized protein n=1 Tax=Kitasatospora paranensis TaxID=258053 RepID=A0ABW2G7W9_9ACTN